MGLILVVFPRRSLKCAVRCAGKVTEHEFLSLAADATAATVAAIRSAEPIEAAAQAAQTTQADDDGSASTHH